MVRSIRDKYVINRTFHPRVAAFADWEPAPSHDNLESHEPSQQYELLSIHCRCINKKLSSTGTIQHTKHPILGRLKEASPFPSVQAFYQPLQPAKFLERLLQRSNIASDGAVPHLFGGVGFALGVDFEAEAGRFFGLSSGEDEICL
nr:hypothetical protein Iba_chr13dCG8910 [Ipomoea batatas]